MKLTLHERIRGCLVGVAVGDAVGMPWELFSHDEIVEATGGRGVRGLEAPPPGHPRLASDPRGLAPGSTTDDWQLTEAVGLSLLRRGGLDRYDMGVAHAEAYRATIQGWGGSTREAIGAYVRWLDSGGAEGRRPGEPAPVAPRRGKGNGVLMKLSPLACLAALGQREGLDARGELRAQVATLGQMTHQEAVSPDVASVLLGLLLGGPASPGAVLAEARDAELHATLEALFGDVEKIPAADEVRLRCGTSFFASESAAFCLATLLRCPDDLERAVLEAINAGGDTDTNASIVGALVGARVGEEGIPRDWRERVPSVARARDLADRLVATFSPR